MRDSALGVRPQAGSTTSRSPALSISPLLGVAHAAARRRAVSGSSSPCIIISCSHRGASACVASHADCGPSTLATTSGQHGSCRKTGLHGGRAAHKRVRLCQMQARVQHSRFAAALI